MSLHESTLKLLAEVDSTLCPSDTSYMAKANRCLEALQADRRFDRQEEWEQKAREFFQEGNYWQAKQDSSKAIAAYEQAIHYGHPEAVEVLTELKKSLGMLEIEVWSPLAIFSFEVVTVNHRGEESSRQQASARYSIEDCGANGLNLEMVYIPGGSFWRGSPDSELEQQSNEIPREKVTVPEFYMGKYPVTQAQWRLVASLAKVEIDLNRSPSNFAGDSRPVEQVNWHQAKEFCARLSKAAGQLYRLPSEAEWEYACRAGTETPFHFGATLTSNLANYDANHTYGNGPKGQYRQTTTPVGEFPANGFGLYDMHGNVWEWCEDIWHENYSGAPKDGSPWLSDGDNSKRMYRGGSWGSYPRGCRSARRGASDPGQRSSSLGFRVVFSAPRT